ncbi:MAG: hypothetical protein R3F61_08190 [Myxococcota bacterium]
MILAVPLASWSLPAWAGTDEAVHGCEEWCVAEKLAYDAERRLVRPVWFEHTTAVHPSELDARGRPRHAVVTFGDGGPQFEWTTPCRRMAVETRESGRQVVRTTHQASESGACTAVISAFDRTIQFPETGSLLPRIEAALQTAELVFSPSTWVPRLESFDGIHTVAGLCEAFAAENPRISCGIDGTTLSLYAYDASKPVPTAEGLRQAQIENAVAGALVESMAQQAREDEASGFLQSIATAAPPDSSEDPLLALVGKHYEVWSLSSACELLQARWGVPITFEGTSDPPIEVVVALPPRGAPSDPTAVLHTVVAADPDTRYQISGAGSGFTVIATATRGPDGQWMPHTPLLDRPITVDLAPTEVGYDGVRMRAWGTDLSIYSVGGASVDVSALIARGLGATGEHTLRRQGPWLPTERLRPLDGTGTTPRSLLALVDRPEGASWTVEAGNEVTPWRFSYSRSISTPGSVEKSILDGHLIAEEDGGGWDPGPPIPQSTVADFVRLYGWSVVDELDAKGVFDLEVLDRRDPEGAALLRNHRAEAARDAAGAGGRPQ